MAGLEEEAGQAGAVVEKGGTFFLCGGSSMKQVAQLGTLLLALHLPLIWIRPSRARFIELEPPLSFLFSLYLARSGRRGMSWKLIIQIAGSHEANYEIQNFAVAVRWDVEQCGSYMKK
jgi:hypothetical protein